MSYKTLLKLLEDYSEWLNPSTIESVVTAQVNRVDPVFHVIIRFDHIICKRMILELLVEDNYDNYRLYKRTIHYLDRPEDSHI